MASVGRRLRAVREQAGLTQAEVAALAGMTQGSLSKLERPSATTRNMFNIFRVATVLGVSLDDLFAETFAPPSRKTVFQIAVELQRVTERIEALLTKMEAHERRH